MPETDRREAIVGTLLMTSGRLYGLSGLTDSRCRPFDQPTKGYTGPFCAGHCGWLVPLALSPAPLPQGEGIHTYKDGIIVIQCRVYPSPVGRGRGEGSGPG